MRSLQCGALAAAIGLVLHPNLRADELVLELTTKLGAERTVAVARVDTGEPLLTRGMPIPQWVAKSDKGFLVLSPSPRLTFGALMHSEMVVAIPWQSIKEVTSKKGTTTVTCEDGAKFTGTILTKVMDGEKREYPLSECTKIVVKKVTKADRKDHAGPTVACTLQFHNLAQSFKAKKAGFGSRAPEQFRMQKEGEVLTGNVSDFEKISLKGSEAQRSPRGAYPIRITTQAPKGKETEGELVLELSQSLFFHSPNDCTVVLYLYDWYAGIYHKGKSFSVMIQATKAGERLPAELFNPIEKKKEKR